MNEDLRRHKNFAKACLNRANGDYLLAIDYATEYVWEQTPPAEKLRWCSWARRRLAAVAPRAHVVRAAVKS